MICGFDFWMKSIDERKFTGSLLLDLSAGFDIIDFDLLFGKLRLYGFNDNVVTWFSSYMKDRHQCVQVKSALFPSFQSNRVYHKDLFWGH